MYKSAIFQRVSLTSFILMMIQIVCIAQIELVFPKQRAVFQRDNNNKGKIHITGVATKEATFVEGRLVPITANQGQASNWSIIDADLKGGTFTGFIEGFGGWYHLELRAGNQSGILQNYVLDKVGIGEVFMVSGQSNAEGFLIHNPLKGSLDDRVNACDLYTITNLQENPTISTFRHLELRENLGPRGDNAWAWGVFGDQIAAKYNVPVLIFNTAYEGTTIENWTKSIKGEPTYHGYYGFLFPGGTPYSTTRIILQNFINTLGMRAMIWIQGESNTLTPVSEYYDGLRFLVERVNFDSGKNINWLVTRTSLTDNVVYPNPVLAQNKLIKDLPNVFAGPITDTIQNPRYDGAHFSGVGIERLGLAISNSFTPALLDSMTPYMAFQVQELNYQCLNNGNLSFGVNGQNQKVLWNTVQESPTYTTSAGQVQAMIRNAIGNYFISEKIYADRLSPAAPVISSFNNGQICPGEFATFLVSNPKNTVLWNNGVFGNQISINQPAQISARYLDSRGCYSGTSNVMTYNTISKPNPPEIISESGKLEACKGEVVVLKDKGNQTSLLWSNGVSGPTVSLTAVGTYQLSAKVQVGNGCESDWSISKTVSVRDLPVTPVITSPNNGFGCNDVGIKLEAVTNEDSVIWSNGSRQKAVSLNEVGNASFTVKAINKFGCFSLPSQVYNTAVFATPAAPVISEDGPYFLKAQNTGTKINWFLDGELLTGVENNVLSISKIGAYNAKAVGTYAFGGTSVSCMSGFSNVINIDLESSEVNVKIYPNPTEDGLIYISSKSELKNARLTLSNVVGQRIIPSFPLGNIQSPVPVLLPANLPRGVYLLTISSGGLDYIFRIFLEK